MRIRDDAIGVEIGRGVYVRFQGQDWEDFRSVPVLDLGSSGAVAKLRHFVRAGIRHSRHPTCLERYLPRIVLNGGHSSSFIIFKVFEATRGEGHEQGQGWGGSYSATQVRLGGEIERELSFAARTLYDSAPLQRCGFEIESEVKMSGDPRNAFALWKTMPGMHQTVEKELNAQGKRLRSLVFEQLSMPFSPASQFRQDKVNPQAQLSH